LRQQSPYADETKDWTTPELWLNSCQKSHCIQNIFEAQPVSYSVGNVGAFPWGKVFGACWILTPIPQKQLLRDNFTIHYIHITLKTVEMKPINLSELAYQVKDFYARAISKKFNNKCAC
jgi:hypothetical protein